MNGLLPSPELVDRTLRIEAAYTTSRIRVLQELPGNPIGIEVREIGDGAIAYMARHFPNPNFNKVIGLKAAQAGEIEGLVRWYRNAGIALQFEILPREGDGELARELSRFGLYPSKFHTSLISAVCDMHPLHEIEAIHDAEAFEDFLDAYIAGWALPDGEGLKRNVRAWLGRPGWSLYLARVDGQPAACAILYLADGGAYLADACCSPDFRGRGLHSALLARRIARAAEARADFACAGAVFQSASHRNMERAGMRIQFVRSVWTGN